MSVLKDTKKVFFQQAYNSFNFFLMIIDVFNYLRILNLVYFYTFFPFFFFSFLIIFNVKWQGEINGFGATLMLLLFLFSRVALSYS